LSKVAQKKGQLTKGSVIHCAAAAHIVE